MSDEDIRDLLDRGAESMSYGPPIDGEDTWAAGRRGRTTRRAWGAGLGAAAAAAGIVGVVWAQGLAGGDAAPPPADTTPGPTEALEPGARGEPFFARFEAANSEFAEQLSGASRPATLEDLQGTWHGPDGEEFVFDGERLVVDTGPPCHVGGTTTVDLTAEGRLVVTGGGFPMIDCWSPELDDMIGWESALWQEPMLSMDGGTLLISGLDGTSEETRAPVALTLGPIDENGFTWADVLSQTGTTPITLGSDFRLLTSGGGDGSSLDSIHGLTLEEHPGDTAYAGTCPLEMEASLRTDGVLLAGAPAPFSACAEDSNAPLPPAEPSPAVVALLRSGPTVEFDDGTMVISGTIPESLLDATTSPPDDTTATSEPTEEGAEDPPVSTDLPSASGTPRVVVMSEGEWAPSGELTPLTAAETEGRRWFQVDSNHPAPTLPGGPGYGLDFDGSSVHVRECAVDVTVPGTLQDGIFVASGEPDVVPDPDPGLDCPVPVYADEWVQVLTSAPRMSTDGEILVIAGGTDGEKLEPVGLALLPEGTEDPEGGPTTVVTVEDLAAGLTEVPGAEASQEIGVSDVRDPQPGHATTLTMESGFVTVDVGCSEPLRGPAWLSYVGPAEVNWQLTAALSEDVDCAAPAAQDAEMWRQMLAHGAFLHHFGDYVIVDAWADPSLTGSGG